MRMIIASTDMVEKSKKDILKKFNNCQKIIRCSFATVHIDICDTHHRCIEPNNLKNGDFRSLDRRDYPPEERRVRVRLMGREAYAVL